MAKEAERMTEQKDRMIVVTGATGLQGGAVTRHLLANGWRVRALTRNRQSEKARALSASGADVVQGDMNDPGTLKPIFEGAYGVFSVQNPMISGVEGEIRQGKNVAEAAREAGVEHLVYGSAGTGESKTGVPSWDSKRVVEEHMRSLGLPLTILRPMAFMELMTEKKFFPQVAAWQVMPALMGSSRPVPWLSTEDMGAIVAKAFADPDRFIGKDLALASDVQSLGECLTLYRQVLGKNPPRFPMPAWLFERFGFVGKDLGKMWRWLRREEIVLETAPTLSIHPEAMSVQEWLMRQ
jgi:uncharacterized protein YbjT (DUF2867 family)